SSDLALTAGDAAEGTCTPPEQHYPHGAHQGKIAEQLFGHPRRVSRGGALHDQGAPDPAYGRDDSRRAPVGGGRGSPEEGGATDLAGGDHRPNAVGGLPRGGPSERPGERAGGKPGGEQEPPPELGVRAGDEDGAEPVRAQENRPEGAASEERGHDGR